MGISWKRYSHLFLFGEPDCCACFLFGKLCGGLLSFNYLIMWIEMMENGKLINNFLFSVGVIWITDKVSVNLHSQKIRADSRGP